MTKLSFINVGQMLNDLGGAVSVALVRMGDAWVSISLCIRKAQ
jgi:hypothetical protein